MSALLRVFPNPDIRNPQIHDLHDSEVALLPGGLATDQAPCAGVFGDIYWTLLSKDLCQPCESFAESWSTLLSKKRVMIGLHYKKAVSCSDREL